MNLLFSPSYLPPRGKGIPVFTAMTKNRRPIGRLFILSFQSEMNPMRRLCFGSGGVASSRIAFTMPVIASS